MTPVLAVNGRAAISLVVRVPQTGVWVADVDLDNADSVGGPAAALTVGTTTFTGAIDAALSGTFLEKQSLRIAGGANGWSKPVTAQHWHNDAGVKDTLVLGSTAVAVGETLVQPARATRIGVDYVRVPGPARRVLERLVPGWYVDYTGVTRVTRPAHTPGDYSLLQFDPRNNVAELYVDDVSAVQVGDTLSGDKSRLSEPLIIRQLEIHASRERGLRLVVWGT